MLTGPRPQLHRALESLDDHPAAGQVRQHPHHLAHGPQPHVSPDHCHAAAVAARRRTAVGSIPDQDHPTPGPAVHVHLAGAVEEEIGVRPTSLRAAWAPPSRRRRDTRLAVVLPGLGAGWMTPRSTTQFLAFSTRAWTPSASTPSTTRSPLGTGCSTTRQPLYARAGLPG